MTTSIKKNYLPPSLVSNLQDVLISRKRSTGTGSTDGEDPSKPEEPETPSLSGNKTNSSPSSSDNANTKPVVLVTNGDGIESPGLILLVEALVREGQYNVHVCAPQSDKSVSGHSVTVCETLAVSSAEMNGAAAFEVSGIITYQCGFYLL